MAYKNAVKAIPLSTFDSASVSSSYQAVNTNGLPNSCYMLRIVNDSDKAITVSYDGSTAQEYVAANTTAQLEGVLNNGTPYAQGGIFPLGLIVYIKGTAGTGTIALSGYYQPSGN